MRKMRVVATGEDGDDHTGKRDGATIRYIIDGGEE
jgi:hypothetical protein